MHAEWAIPFAAGALIIAGLGSVRALGAFARHGGGAVGSLIGMVAALVAFFLLFDVASHDIAFHSGRTAQAACAGNGGFGGATSGTGDRGYILYGLFEARHVSYLCTDGTQRPVVRDTLDTFHAAAG
jgi:hypothetical protein